MAISQGLIDTYWRRYNQRKALTGFGPSYQETRGALDPIMEAAANRDIGEARVRSDTEARNRSLSLQEQAQKDAAKAATISGVTQMGGTLGGGYLAYKALTKPDLAGEAIAKYLSGAKAPSMAAAAPAAVSAGAGSAGILSSAGVGSGAAPPLMAAMNPATAAAPFSYGAVGGEMGAGLGAGAAVPGLLSAAGPAALAAGAGQLLGKPVSKLLGTHEKTTGDVMSIGGAAATGFAIAGPAGGLIGAALGGLASLF